jgi:hypothetical protein
VAVSAADLPRSAQVLLHRMIDRRDALLRLTPSGNP